MIPKAYKHGYSGSCTPKNSYATQGTFSVGIFQWIPKASGKGLKKSTVKFRIKGNVVDAEKVYCKAKELCESLNRGITPVVMLKQKSLTIRR